MRKLNILGGMAVCCLWLLPACRVGQQHKTAGMDLPAEFRLPDSVSVNLDDAIVPWEQFFQDTLLARLVANAFAQNFDIRTADKEIEINDRLYAQSKLAFFPRLDLNLLRIEKDWNSKNSGSSVEKGWYDARDRQPPRNMYLSTSDYSSTAALSWELDIWGKLKQKKQAAKALYLQSFEARKAIQTEVVATVAEEYYTLLMLDEQLTVARENFHFRDSTLTMIRLQYNSGEVTALAVQQARSQVLEAAALLPELEKERAIQENKLRLLTGELPGYIARETTLSALDTTYSGVKDLPLYLVQNRPDVLVAGYQLKAANAAVGVTQAERFPDLTISLVGGVDAILAKNWFNIPGSLLGGLVGGLTAPVFNGRQLKTNFEVAKLERDEAEISFQRIVYHAVVDVKNSLVSIEKLGEQLQIAEEQQQVSQKAVESSRMLFRAGFATYLEVITAQGEALNSELGLATAKANLLIGRIQLYRALGGGWKQDSGSP